MKNIAKLKQLGLATEENGVIKFSPDVKFYYLKFGGDNHGRATGGVATVCIIRAQVARPGSNILQPTFVRGVSFCNPCDQFVRKLGRNIALGRAIQAIENRCNSGLIPKWSVKKPAGRLIDDCDWRYFSMFDVRLVDSTGGVELLEPELYQKNLAKMKESWVQDCDKGEALKLTNELFDRNANLLPAGSFYYVDSEPNVSGVNLVSIWLAEPMT